MSESDALSEASRLLRWTIEEETGIHLRDLELEVEDGEARATLGTRALARVGFADPPGDPNAVAEALHLSLGSKLKERLVELERARLEEELVPAVERSARSALAEADTSRGEELELSVVALPYRYRHGDPEEAQERGYPPFGLRVRGADLDVDVTVELELEPPDPERLSRRVVEKVLEVDARGG